MMTPIYLHQDEIPSNLEEGKALRELPYLLSLVDQAAGEQQVQSHFAGLASQVTRLVAKHLSVMTELNKQGRYDRMTDDLFKLTGQKPISMYNFVKLHAAEFTRDETAD